MELDGYIFTASSQVTKSLVLVCNTFRLVCIFVRNKKLAAPSKRRMQKHEKKTLLHVFFTELSEVELRELGKLSAFVCCVCLHLVCTEYTQNTSQ